MTHSELEIVKRVRALLRSLADEPLECESILRDSPVGRFAREYLAADLQSDLTCDEAWTYYQEIAQANELPQMRKAVFLRQLPSVMQVVYHVRKSHHIERFGRRLRGFRGINLRSQVLTARDDSH
jgi:hypothetical protein